MLFMKKDLIDQLYDSQKPFLMDYAYKRVQREDVAEELVQDTFCEASAKYEELVNHENPTGWLYVTLKYKILQYWERKKRYSTLFADYNPEWTSQEDIDPIRLMEMRDLLHQIQQLLSEEEYYIIERVLHYGDAFTTVAQSLDISEAACRKRFQRARKKIRKAFPNEEIFND